MSNAAEGIGRYLAEGTLALILASLKDITGYNHSMKEEKAWPLTVTYTESLFEKNIGLIGLGKIGRHLVRLLKPFNVRYSCMILMLTRAFAKNWVSNWRILIQSLKAPILFPSMPPEPVKPRICLILSNYG